MDKETAPGNKIYYLLTPEEEHYVEKINPGWLTMTNRRPDGTKRILFLRTDTDSVREAIEQFEKAITDGGFPINDAPVPKTD